MPTDNNRVPNRLINETSPYLLQHAYNPVDWYPWGEEAFAKAKAEDKPVFLSIGYSTCHWCHVMEHESFEDDEAADYLNEHFVSIKVDKEERPDVDAVYMTVCQALTGSGGWPMTIIMTPEQKPFYAGTYLPKHNRYGHMGLMELLAAVRRKWEDERDSLLESGDKIADALVNREISAHGARELDKNVVEQAARHLSQSYDRRYGGFGVPPKFPTPHNLMFLLRIHALGVRDDALDMVGHTLKQMYKGGIFDHIGFGFSRYSTDEKWLAPHFEKMLYDNAMMTMVFLECFQITKNPFYKSVAEKTLLYIGREMTSHGGGFYSAQDADIDGEEGKFYTFTPKEVEDAVGKRDGKTFCGRYDVTVKGNFEGKSIPNLIACDDVWLPDAEMESVLSGLYDYRQTRFKLHKDDKILTSWNALMIVAYAKAYRVLGNRDYLSKGVCALLFIDKHLTGSDGNLLISYRDDKAKGQGVLDDYAFLAWACLELYESTFDVAYLEKARKLTDNILTRFPSETGGFYLYANDGERLILRPKEQFDGAIPSGNSVAAYCLSRLAAITGEDYLREAAEKQLKFYADMFTRQPTACTFALLALMLEVYPTRELVCVVESGACKENLAAEIGGLFIPQTSVVIKTTDESGRLAKIAPFTEAYGNPPEHKGSYYLCRNYACNAPIHDIEELKRQI